MNMEAGDFSKRLKQACDDTPVVPEMGKGRYTAIAKHMQVSEEAVRKWFAGESRPRMKMMPRLSSFLGVDEGWLALGITPEATARQKRIWSAQANGAVYTVFGLATTSGASCAIPEEDEHANLYIIVEARQISVYVSVARTDDDRTYRVSLPRGYDKSRVLAYVPKTGFDFDLLLLPEEDLTPRCRKKAGRYELTLERSGRAYVTEGHRWPKARGLQDLV